MSISKRYLFDPTLASQRQNVAEVATAAFRYPIPMNRKNKLSAHPRWDPFWKTALHNAAAELNIRCVVINTRLCFEQEADQVRGRERAEALLQEKHQHNISQLKT